jgi:hypothetical protein
MYLRSNEFSVNAGGTLHLLFNYVTTDGGASAAYSWIRLLDQALNQIGDPLFSYQTSNIPLNLLAEPQWYPLTGSNDESAWCYLSDGCGQTGWIPLDYTFINAGDYILEFGVVNWFDDSYPSALAFDSIMIAAGEQTPSDVPEPASLALVGLGLFGLGVSRRRKSV